jgi:hypothetical protein
VAEAEGDAEAEMVGEVVGEREAAVDAEAVEEGENEEVALGERVGAAEAETEAEGLCALQPVEADRMTVPAGQRTQVVVAPGSEYV